MKYLFLYFGQLLYFVFPLKISRYLLNAIRYLNTGYHKRSLKKIGKNSTIDYPLRLIGGENISIGDDVSISKRSIITTWDNSEYKHPEIIIGNKVSIGVDCHITAINKILIGNQILMGNKITISDNSHGINNSLIELQQHPSARKLFSKGPVIINDRVWIGDKATILAGVTIGENSIIGANSVVTKDIPKNSIAVGIPAKIIRSIT